MRKSVAKGSEAGPSKLTSALSKLDGRAIEEKRVESKKKVRAIATVLSPDLSKGARHYVIARLLGMQPLTTGARRIRSIWHGNAGATVLIDFLYRFEAWREQFVARHEALAESEFKAFAELLDTLEAKLDRNDQDSGAEDMADASRSAKTRPRG